MKEKLITRKPLNFWEPISIYGEGGALTSYARYIGGSAAGGADFQVLSDRESREWAEKKLSADEYCKIFGEPEDFKMAKTKIYSPDKFMALLK